MNFIFAKIVRFVDSRQPGWVECEFYDTDGRLHTVKDKVAIFTTEEFDAERNCPAPGVVPCQVLEQLRDDSGRELVRVSTEKPYDIESTDGLSEFVVLASLVKSVPD